MGSPPAFDSSVNYEPIYSSNEQHSAAPPAQNTAYESLTFPQKTKSQIEIASRADKPEVDHRAIVLRNVDKVFESPAGKFQALKSINMQLNYGQFISIVGKSGSGKSTLLNMITGIDHPTSGEVIVGDQHIYQMSKSDRALWRGRNMGVVFQFFQLLPTLTFLKTRCCRWITAMCIPFNERPERAMELLQMVGLEEQAHKLPASVSSGQQQSAAIARALANDPCYDSGR